VVGEQPVSHYSGAVVKAGTARKVASAAALGGGGLSALGVGLYGLLRAEAMLARRLIGDATVDPPNATGWYGRRRPGPAIRVAVLGDSGMAGYGVERVEETPGAHLASGISAYSGRRVYLGAYAVVGAQSSHIMAQLERALMIEPDVVVISVGTNDVTHTVGVSTSVAHLSAAVRRARDAGIEVVVGTCPDLGTVRPINPPLRQVAREWSRRLAKAQSIAAVQAGARSVSLATILGPEFDARPTDLFGPDRFHPSAEGYAAFAGVLLPTVLAALGLVPAEEEATQALRGEGLVPLSRAASEAARTPGTELDGSETGASRRGVRCRLVELRHRRRQPQVETEPPAPELEPADA
jgi:lysophospholipase L1-like esterase